ncbi:MAG: aminotransferase class I/II-fold pyridoxal phosphate-dependent enzyme [Bacteroidia bacterium]|jgi:dTDP-4-amino-4,6-dideoxygalactose transaminase|nr:aminotransferase class I/II-fold pyridoxal phosphate-dependent enzyme [Bacteroidia bacterium]
MTNKKIYLSSPHMGGNEIKYVKDAIDTNWVAPLGPNVNGFEDALAAYNGISNCAALSSGTAALHLALILLGVEQDDEVLCSTFTFSATVNAIAYQKAIPVFIDSEKETWNMCPVTLEKAIQDRITKGKKPKAVIIVHLYGMPSDMDSLTAVCSAHDIPIIEDSAEALGASYKGRKMGTFGVLGAYSFNGNKIITTSGGGALVSNNAEYISKATFLATQARDDASHYEHSHIGYNYRMSNILAGIGRGQLEVLDKHIALRRANNVWYQELFASYDFIEVFKEPCDDYFSNHWLSCIVVNPNSKGITRESIRLALAEENIECRPLWKPMHQQPVFQEYPSYLNGTSDYLFNVGLCLPSGSNLGNEDRKRIKEALLAVLS